MSTASRVIRNTGILYVKVGISAICAILSTRFILQSLGIDDFGIYNIVGSIIVMLSFLNESMTTATQRFISFSEGQGQIDKSITVFNISVLLHFLIGILIAIVLFLLGYIVFNGILKIPPDRVFAARYVYYFMIFSAFLSMITVPYNAVLIAHENMLYYSIIGSIVSILKLIVAIVLLYISGDKLILYGLLIACVSLVELTIPRIYCKQKYRECRINVREYYNKDLFKEMTAFAKWQLLYSSSSILSIQGTSLLLNSFFGVIVNAAQGVARQLSGQLMIFSNTLLNALNPVIVKSAGAGNHSQMINSTMLGSKLAFLLVLVFSVPVLIEMPFLLNIWLKEVPDYAVGFCRFEIIQQLMASLTVTLVTSISAKGDIKSFQIFSAITYFGRLPVIYIFLKLGFNPISVYYVSTIAVFILCVGRVYFASHKSGLDINSFLQKVIYPSGGLAALMVLSALPIHYLFSVSLFRLFLVIAVSSVVMLIGLRVFALTQFERQIIEDVIKDLKGHGSR